MRHGQTARSANAKEGKQTDLERCYQYTCNNIQQKVTICSQSILLKGITDCPNQNINLLSHTRDYAATDILACPRQAKRAQNINTTQTTMLVPDFRRKMKKRKTR